MTEERPLVDRTVAKTPVLGPLGLLLVLAVIGLVILGARSISSLMRGLDQEVQVQAEPAAAKQ